MSVLGDNQDLAYNKFLHEREHPLPQRFPGYYRAKVVETNDPLVIGRIRVKVPELHDVDLDEEMTVWAVASPDLGTKRQGRYTHPCIDDWVWITFEKEHAYGVIWVGFADPTRRKFYPLPFIHQTTPVSLDEQGNPEGSPDDFNDEYLPKDGRPMATGQVDRYGHTDIFTAVGFFPKEHDLDPVPAGIDAVQKKDFEIKKERPQVNDPDVKYAARITKGGMILLQSDVGYRWKEEFKGDFTEDESFEIERWKYIQKFLNEDEPKEKDQRRYEAWTRYGHRFEMRDVGWYVSRDGEYGEQKTIGDPEADDQRWIKLRTKGGHLRQMMDMGFNQQDDNFVKRKLIEEVGEKADKEDQFWPKEKDARMIRDVTRYGLKFVLDDRGTSSVSAEENDEPRSNGVLIKGRRSPGSSGANPSGDPRGFYFEIHENNTANFTTWGSPLGQTAQINDNSEHIILTTRLKNYARPWKGLEENEFLLEPVFTRRAHENSHNLLLDLQNEFVQLKTRGQKGDPPDSSFNTPDVDRQQGFEARDGQNQDGPWVEVLASEGRGMWLSKNIDIAVLRGKDGGSQAIWLDDRAQELVIFNGAENGRVRIFGLKGIELISDADINLRAVGNINMKCGDKVNIDAGGNLWQFGTGAMRTNVRMEGPELYAFCCGVEAGPGAGCPRPGGVALPPVFNPQVPQIIPTDRGMVYNEPIVTPVEEVEHKI